MSGPASAGRRRRAAPLPGPVVRRVCARGASGPPTTARRARARTRRAACALARAARVRRARPVARKRLGGPARPRAQWGLNAGTIKSHEPQSRYVGLASATPPAPSCVRRGVRSTIPTLAPRPPQADDLAHPGRLHALGHLARAAACDLPGARRQRSARSCGGERVYAVRDGRSFRRGDPGGGMLPLRRHSASHAGRGPAGQAQVLGRPRLVDRGPAALLACDRCDDRAA